MSNDSLGIRMKEYEGRETSRRFLPMLPVYARIDGRSFSKFTKDFDRPYDMRMSLAMVATTKDLVEKTHARIGYTQSDEISLVWMSENYDHGIFFDGKIMKMTSVLAGLATTLFARQFPHLSNRIPHFDCRVLQLPNKTEAANMFLWRELDATKNAVSMAARSMYSHKELQNKSGSEMQELMFLKGVNFNDYPEFFKRGSFVRRALVEKEYSLEELSLIPEKYRPEEGTTAIRSEILNLYMPKFSTVTNREDVIFDGAEPSVREIEPATGLP